MVFTDSIPNTLHLIARRASAPGPCAHGAACARGSVPLTSRSTRSGSTQLGASTRPVLSLEPSVAPQGLRMKFSPSSEGRQGLPGWPFPIMA